MTPSPTLRGMFAGSPIRATFTLLAAALLPGLASFTLLDQLLETSDYPIEVVGPVRVPDSALKELLESIPGLRFEQILQGTPGGRPIPAGESGPAESTGELPQPVRAFGQSSRSRAEFQPPGPSAQRADLDRASPSPAVGEARAEPSMGADTPGGLLTLMGSGAAGDSDTLKSAILRELDRRVQAGTVAAPVDRTYRFQVDGQSVVVTDDPFDGFSIHSAHCSGTEACIRWLAAKLQQAER